MLGLQFLYLGILVLAGFIVLSLRRKANGTRTGYKLLLLLFGLLLGIISKENTLLSFDPGFISSLSVFLLIVLLFELSVRLNHENLVMDYKNVGMFFAILITNIIILGILSTYLLNISPIHASILAVILSSVEYFLVDALKNEGDLANPLIILFAVTIMVYYGLQGDVFENTIYLLQYLFIGLATGVFMGIIIFRLLRYKQSSIANELGMIALVCLTYIVTDQLHGSGLFAVMIVGIFFGNSHVRKTSSMHNFSSTIFKGLEMMIYLLVGFVAALNFDGDLWWKSLAIFAAYLLLRFIIISIYYRHHSMKNKLLLSLAPKGMILGSLILVLGSYSSVESSLINAMLFILAYSLVFGLAVEHVEQERTIRVHKYELVGSRLQRVR